MLDNSQNVKEKMHIRFFNERSLIQHVRYPRDTICLPLSNLPYCHLLNLFSFRPLSMYHSLSVCTRDYFHIISHKSEYASQKILIAFSKSLMAKPKRVNFIFTFF